ncbi:MAG TPA: type II toxin-antitoxin system HicA family toxin [Thermaerobacter sp.]
MKKEIREIIRYLQKEGWTLRQGGKHYVLTKGDKVLTLPKTPGDHRSMKNVYADLRRAGIQWPPEGKKPSGRKR